MALITKIAVKDVMIEMIEITARIAPTEILIEKALQIESKTKPANTQEKLKINIKMLKMRLETRQEI